MKSISFTVGNSFLEFIFSWRIFRKLKYLRLPMIGMRKKRRKYYELDGRIIQNMVVYWRWCFFFDYVRIKYTSKNFTYFSNDPFPLKCYIEYEHWKHEHPDFNRNAFLQYMCNKFQKTSDEVYDGCIAVMIDLMDNRKSKEN